MVADAGIPCAWYWLCAMLVAYFGGIRFQSTVNLLAPWRSEFNLRWVIFKLSLVINGLAISGEIALKWMSQELTDDVWTLVQEWLGVVRQQAITWANVDPDLCHHTASPGHNECWRMMQNTNTFWWFMKTVCKTLPVINYSLSRIFLIWYHSCGYYVDR